MPGWSACFAAASFTYVSNASVSCASWRMTRNVPLRPKSRSALAPLTEKSGRRTASEWRGKITVSRFVGSAVARMWRGRQETAIVRVASRNSPGSTVWILPTAPASVCAADDRRETPSTKTTLRREFRFAPSPVRPASAVHQAPAMGGDGGFEPPHETAARLIDAVGEDCRIGTFLSAPHFHSAVVVARIGEQIRMPRCAMPCRNAIGNMLSVSAAARAFQSARRERQDRNPIMGGESQR